MNAVTTDDQVIQLGNVHNQEFKCHEGRWFASYLVKCLGLNVISLYGRDKQMHPLYCPSTAGARVLIS